MEGETPYQQFFTIYSIPGTPTREWVWTPDGIYLILNLLISGLSYAEISEHLSDEFDLDISEEEVCNALERR